jgi:hypothetical protein
VLCVCVVGSIVCSVRDDPNNVWTTTWPCTEYGLWNGAQRFVLAVFWYTCGGPHWTLSNASEVTFLNASRPECQWHGVQCDLNQAITALHLDNSNVSCPASLPTELAALSCLVELDMDSNAIAGTLPNWMGTAWPQFEILDLDSTIAPTVLLSITQTIKFKWYPCSV